MREAKMKVEKKRPQWLNSIQIRRMLGNISRQYFWQLKVRKNFPDPVYSEDGIELWEEEKIKEYIKKRNN